jgi:hypothetical protein
MDSSMGSAMLAVVPEGAPETWRPGAWRPGATSVDKRFRQRVDSASSVPENA